MSYDNHRPIWWQVSPEQVGVNRFTAEELVAAGYELVSKQPVDDETACVWWWRNEESKRDFVALRTGGAGRGRGKVLIAALVFSQEHLVDVLDKLARTSLVVA